MLLNIVSVFYIVLASGTHDRGRGKHSRIIQVIEYVDLKFVALSSLNHGSREGTTSDDSAGEKE